MNPDVLRASIAIEISEMNFVSTRADATCDFTSWPPADVCSVGGISSFGGALVVECLDFAVGADPEVFGSPIAVEVCKVDSVDVVVAHLLAVWPDFGRAVFK